MTLDLPPNEDTRNLNCCGLGMEARLHNDTDQWVNIIRGVRALGSLSLRSYRGARGPFLRQTAAVHDAEAPKGHIEMQYIAPYLWIVSTPTPPRQILGKRSSASRDLIWRVILASLQPEESPHPDSIRNNELMLQRSLERS